MAEVHAPDALTVAVVGGIVAVITTCITAVVAFFGGKGSAAAQFQTALNTGFASLSVELRKDKDDCEARCQKLEGEIAALRQHMYSLEGILRRHGIDVPKLPPVATVFVLDSQDQANVGH